MEVLEPPSPSRTATWLAPALLGLLLLAGIWLRWPAPSDAVIKGFDESIYSRYVTVLAKNGVGGLPGLCTDYLRLQPQAPAFLPPTRILFLSSAASWSEITGMTPLESIRCVSSLSACLLLLLAAGWAYSLGGMPAALGVTALMAFAPTQIHMAHRALIDGFFAFWAVVSLFGLWQALTSPNPRVWLWIYGLGLAACVMTKENAAFVWIAICGLLLVNHFLKFGKATLATYGVTFLAPFVAVLILTLAAGGPSTLVAVYRLNVAKSMVLPYGILTGDGPWFRYLTDLLLVSPVVLLFAVGATCNLRRSNAPGLYFALFVGFSMAVMCQVKQGMNLRYGNMWDLPLRWLAWTQIVSWAGVAAPRLRPAVAALLVTLVCCSELAQYTQLFTSTEGKDGRAIYDPTTEALVRKLEMVKTEDPRIPSAPQPAAPPAPAAAGQPEQH